jgi:bifunctional ADP-heptose synthase (sugar kinase/adenylyltransferase)
LDTRSKIVSAEDARRRLDGQVAQWVSADFDPLLAEHVQWLREHSVPGRRLVVEITNPDRPLLAQRARAELVAALAMVDYVVLGNGKSASGSDSGITQKFIEHVLRRHGGPGKE